MDYMKKTRWVLAVALVAALTFLAGRQFFRQAELEKIIFRLQADSRAAQVLVTGVNYNEEQHKNFTTIKFLEFDTKGRALEPKYFTFPGNIIQFQSLVVRFDDKFVMAGDRVRGKSVYLFLKAFMLEGANTKEFVINPAEGIPTGYKLDDKASSTEQEFWSRFWSYAFDKKAADRAGIKNVQIEAPGTMFIPGYMYTIKIEHNGGLRIDTTPLPDILRGEKIL
jgi:hypothetical protein